MFPSLRRSALPLILLCCPIGLLAAEEEPILLSPLTNAQDLPALKFFYFNPSSVEWVVSSDKEAFAEHIQNNERSRQLVTTLHAAVLGEHQAESARANMTQWIAERREAFEQGGSDATRFRKAEGIVAYLRAHDFSVASLTQAIKKRSGATSVELVAIHQQSGESDSSVTIKVVPVDPVIEIGKEGFNVEIQSADSGYVRVTYALGLALYEIQELITDSAPAEELPEPNALVAGEEPIAEPLDEALGELLSAFQ